MAKLLLCTTLLQGSSASHCITFQSQWGVSSGRTGSQCLAPLRKTCYKYTQHVAVLALLSKDCPWLSDCWGLCSGQGPCSAIASPWLHKAMDPDASLLPCREQQCWRGHPRLWNGLTFNSHLLVLALQGFGAGHAFRRLLPWGQRLERARLQQELLFTVGIELQILKPIIGGGEQIIIF